MAATTVDGKIEDALLAKAALLATSLGLTLALPNSAFDPPGVATGYLRAFHIPNENVRHFVGSGDPHERLGMLQITYVAPLKAGSAAMRDIAGAIADYFAVDSRMVSGGVIVKVYKAPEVAQGHAIDGRWEIPVTVSYRCFA